MKDNRPSGGPRVAVVGSLEAALGQRSSRSRELASWGVEVGGSESVADGDVCVDLP